MRTVILFIVLTLLPFYILAQEIDDNILENREYKKRIEFFRNNPIKKGQIVFLGNSLTFAGKWNTYFPNKGIVNRGISGDNTDGMLARVHEIVDSKPIKIFVMVGINDISLQRENETILRQVKLLVRQLRAGSPDTQIFIQSTLPINAEKLRYSRLEGKEIQIEHYNTSLKSLCNEMGLTYIDIYAHLLEQPLTLDSKYTNDGLHINSEAYAIWAKQLKFYIEQQ